jgi:hypothetical protein
MRRKSLRETISRAHARERAMHEIEISHGRGVVASTLKLLPRWGRWIHRLVKCSSLNYGRGRGVGRTLGVGASRGVGVTRGVGDAVGVAVGAGTAKAYTLLSPAT